MSETRYEDEGYRNIAEELIKSESELEYIKNSSVKIVYLESDKEKKSNGKTVFAECEKIPDKYRWKIDADFSIVVYSPNAFYFNVEQMKILLFHELLHIGIEKDEAENEKYFVRPHDLEDFKLIIDRFGTDWATNPESKEED